MRTSTERLLRVDGLRLERSDGAPLVDGVGFELHAGQTLAVVGESGSGKSLTALALAGLLPPGVRWTQGQAHFEQRALRALRPADWRHLQGRRIGMIFQEPMSSLNPVMRVGEQIAEVLRTHLALNRDAAGARAVELLRQVQIPEPERRAGQYPHQLSGGQRQRVMIAMALACDPALLIADEPTTALDVTVQAGILELLQRLQRERGLALLLITHDLGVVRQVADRVVVLYGGRVMEYGAAAGVLDTPAHPYTQGLLRARPSALVPRSQRLQEIPGTVAAPSRERLGCPFAPRCAQAQPRCSAETPPLQALGLPAAGRGSACWLAEAGKGMGTVPGAGMASVTAPGPPARSPLLQRGGIGGGPALELADVGHAYAGGGMVVDGATLTLQRGESLGLVGESGCGKSTLARLACGLLAPGSGQVRVGGADPARRQSITRLALARAVQMVFQDPYGSLNPRQRVGTQIAEPLRLHAPGPAEEHAQRVTTMLQRVGLPAEAARRYPHELSGGQRQRVAIARALVVEPALLVCDEPVSALDVSVQAQILNLLRELQRELGLALLFISHDLRVVRCMADRIAVMRKGRIVELGETDQLWAAPQHPYTAELLAALPPEV